MPTKYGIFGAAYEGDGSTSSEATGATVTADSTTDRITWTSVPLVDGDKVFFQTSGTMPGGLSGTTTYYVRDKATNDFKVAATSGGAAIDITSNGTGTLTACGVGAWKLDQTTVGTSTVASILAGNTPNHGTLAAGDLVEIRCKTGNGANANISVTLTASITLGNASGTLASPIVWRLDDGTVWSGVTGGTLTYTTSSSSYLMTLRAYNTFISRTRYNWVLEWTGTTTANTACTLSGKTDGLLVSAPNKTSTQSLIYIDKPNVHTDLKVSSKNTSTIQAAACTVTLVNPQIEITTTASAITVFYYGGNWGVFRIRGGRIYGSGASTGAIVCQGPSNASYQFVVDSVGFTFPNTMTFASWQSFPNGTFSFVGLDGGLGGAMAEYGYQADSRADNYCPTLNATQPDSGATGVSWKLAPTTNCSADNPSRLTVAKVFTDTAASKTVTLEFLQTTSWAGGSMNAKTVWMEVCYIDNSTGIPVRQTTYDEAAASLSTSSASWSSTTWGAISMSKKKLALTTSGSIKQDTSVTVTLFCTSASGGANDVMIVCPDVQLS